MAIWSRDQKDKRVYFNTDTALIKKQDAKLTIKLFGITLVNREIEFDAEDLNNKASVGFNTK